MASYLVSKIESVALELGPELILPKVLRGMKRATGLSTVESLRKDHIFKLRKLK